MMRRAFRVLILALIAVVLLAPATLAGPRGGGAVRVRGYFRKDGTYVQPHYRSAPDGNFWNNWSTKGNINPYTGKEGTKTVPPIRSRDPYRVPISPVPDKLKTKIQFPIQSSPIVLHRVGTITWKDSLDIRLSAESNSYYISLILSRSSDSRVSASLRMTPQGSFTKESLTSMFPASLVLKAKGTPIYTTIIYREDLVNGVFVTWDARNLCNIPDRDFADITSVEINPVGRSGTYR